MKEVEASIDLYNLSHSTNAEHGPLVLVDAAPLDVNNGTKRAAVNRRTRTPQRSPSLHAKGQFGPRCGPGARSAFWIR